MVGTIAVAIGKAHPFEIPPSKSPDFKCFRISNISGFQMVRFQIPTVGDIKKISTTFQKTLKTNHQSCTVLKNGLSNSCSKIFRYNSTMEIVSPDLKRLFTPHVTKMRTSLEPGLSEITWTNFDWVKFTDHVSKAKTVCNFNQKNEKVKK